MKIVHVVYSMEVGGAESLVAQLCRLQREHGHDVTVIAQAKLGVLGEQLRAEGFRVEVPGTGNPLRTFPRWLRLFRALRPDVVHCHNPAPTMQAAPAARAAGAKTIISTRHSLVAPPYNQKEERLFGVAAQFCDWIVGICEATCVNLRGAPLARRKHIVRVYNGCAELARGTDQDRAMLRAEASASQGSAGAAEQGTATDRGIIFVFVGRLAPIKDLGTMLRAFAEACASAGLAGAAAEAGEPDRDLRLWIVGDGPERGRLEALVSELGVADRVRFWGERHDVARFFAAADVFTMSSISEGLPMSLLQAMSAGLPALVTDVGGMAEVVRLAEGGLTAPVGDSAALAKQMLVLASNAELRRRAGEAGRAVFAREFTLAHMDAGYMHLYLQSARAGANAKRKPVLGRELL